MVDPRTAAGTCQGDGVAMNNFDGTYSNAYVTGGVSIILGMCRYAQADMIRSPVLVPLLRPRHLPTPGLLRHSPMSPPTPCLFLLNILRPVLLLPCLDLPLPLPGLLPPSMRVTDGSMRTLIISRRTPLSAGVPILQSILRLIWLFPRVLAVRG